MIKRNYFLKTTKNVILTLEDDSVPFINYLMTFVFVITLRNFVESFSQESFNYFSLNNTTLALNFLHTSLSYVAIALQIILLFYYATRESLIKIAKVVLPSFIVLLGTPCLDLLITSGKGHDIAYYLPTMSGADVIKNYFTYSSYYEFSSPGIRIEVFIFLLGIYYYLRVKHKSITTSLLYTVLGYTLIFLWGCSPFLIQPILVSLRFDYSYSPMLMLNYFSLLVLFLGIWILFLTEKRRLVSLLKSLTLNYTLCSVALLSGLIWSFFNDSAPITEQLHQYPDTILSLIFSLISLLFATAFVAIVKETNFEYCLKIQVNYETDVDNNYRRWIGYIALTLAGLYACLAGTKAFIIISFFVSCDYLLYVPPFRLGRVPFLWALSTNSKLLALFLLGHLFLKNQMLFPQGFFFGLLSTLFFSSVVPYYDLLFKKIFTKRYASTKEVASIKNSEVATNG